MKNFLKISASPIERQQSSPLIVTNLCSYHSMHTKAVYLSHIIMQYFLVVIPNYGTLYRKNIKSLSYIALIIGCALY
jgi:hypothetical protein